MAGIFHKIFLSRYKIPYLIPKLSPIKIGVRKDSTYMSCEKDDWTNSCGMSLLTKTACCAKPHGSKHDSRSTKFRAKPKQTRDEFDVNCEAARQSKGQCAKERRIGFTPRKTLTAKEMLYFSKECCVCLPETPHLDELYYKIRKLSDRCYAPTWKECPKPRIVPKLVCCYEKEPFEFPRRPKCKRPPTACPWEIVVSKLQTCKKGGDPNCVKVQSPCCCPARNPPTCVKHRLPLCTERIKTPAPSFSECNIKVKPLKPSECRCMNKIYSCELYDIVNYNVC